MAEKSSTSWTGPAIAFIAGVGLAVVVGGVLVASSGPDASQQRDRSPDTSTQRTTTQKHRKQPMGHAMPVSTGNSSEDCGCDE